MRDDFARGPQAVGLQHLIAAYAEDRAFVQHFAVKDLAGCPARFRLGMRLVRFFWRHESRGVSSAILTGENVTSPKAAATSAAGRRLANCLYKLASLYSVCESHVHHDHYHRRRKAGSGRTRVLAQRLPRNHSDWSREEWRRSHDADQGAFARSRISGRANARLGWLRRAPKARRTQNEGPACGVRHSL